MEAIGLSKPQVIALANEAKTFRIGSLSTFEDKALGTQTFIYAEAGGTITERGFACVQLLSGIYIMLDTTSSAPGLSQGMPVAFAPAAMIAGDLGWFQVWGRGPVRTLGDAAAGTILNSTATPGALDDDATAGAEVITGVSLSVLSGGAAETNENGFLTWPTVGATIPV